MARTVLLADDSVTAQNMGRRILMDAGYEVVTVNNGSAALKKIHESKPDLIVLDVYMPGYGGLEVCQRLKESEETARIPVLLSVGKMEPFKAEEARRVRADGHIVKPFEASELLAALTKLEDRIVPQSESASGRPGKSEKKSRFWKTEDPLAGAEEVPTERVAYLTQAKKRQSHDEATNEAAEADTQESISAVAPAASAEQLDAKRTPSPVSSAAIEEFAVRESDVPKDVPAESAGNDGSSAELQAAEPAVEIPAALDAGAVENPSMEYPTAEIPVAEDPARPAALSRESISEEEAAVPAEEEAASGPSAEMVTPDEAPAVARASSPSRWIAENVALTVEEASVALEAEMQQAQAVSAEHESHAGIPAQDQFTRSNPAVPETVQEQEAENENPTGAAFAAAASAAGSVQQSAVSSQPASAAAGDTNSVSEAELPAASEAAAAWQNWQHIREAVMSPQKAAELAESVAEIAQASVAAQEPTSSQDSVPSDSASPAPAEADNSINDIVDSVLADLKPRLMAEIAKKLAAKK